MHRIHKLQTFTLSHNHFKRHLHDTCQDVRFGHSHKRVPGKQIFQGWSLTHRHGVAGMAESQVHVTQAHKGLPLSVKPEQNPESTPPHHSLHTSDEDPLSTPYQSPRDSMQLDDDLSPPGRQGVKAEPSEVSNRCACSGTSQPC